MHEKISAKNSWITHGLTLFAGIIVAGATVYFAQLYRQSIDIRASIVSMREATPNAKPVDMTAKHLLALDSLTKKFLPELYGLLEDRTGNLLQALKNHPKQDRLSRMNIDFELKKWDVTLSVPIRILEDTVEAIEVQPSNATIPQKTIDYKARINAIPINSPVVFVKEFQKFMKNHKEIELPLQLSKRAEIFRLNFLATIWRKLGVDKTERRKKVISELKKIKESLLEAGQRFNQAREKAFLAAKKALALARKQVRSSKENANRQSRFEIKISFLNNGQLPVTLSRFGLLVVGENFVVPIKRKNNSSNVFLLPETAMEVLFITPTKGKRGEEKSRQFWKTLMNFKNSGSKIICRFYLLPDGHSVQTSSSDFIEVSKEQERVSRILMAPNERLPADLSKFEEE